MEDDIEREKFEKIPDDENVGLEETVEQRIKRKRRWEKLVNYSKFIEMLTLIFLYNS